EDFAEVHRAARAEPERSLELLGIDEVAPQETNAEELLARRAGDEAGRAVHQENTTLLIAVARDEQARRAVRDELVDARGQRARVDRRGEARALERRLEEAERAALPELCRTGELRSAASPAVRREELRLRADAAGRDELEQVRPRRALLGARLGRTNRRERQRLPLEDRRRGMIVRAGRRADRVHAAHRRQDA